MTFEQLQRGYEQTGNTTVLRCIFSLHSAGATQRFQNHKTHSKVITRNQAMLSLPFVITKQIFSNKTNLLINVV